MSEDKQSPKAKSRLKNKAEIMPLIKPTRRSGVWMWGEGDKKRGHL